MQHKGSGDAWDPDRFRTALHAIRDGLDVRQTQLAEWAGVSPPQVSRWLGGRSRPGYDSIRRLQRAILSTAPERLALVQGIGDAAGYPGFPTSRPGGPTAVPDADADADEGRFTAEGVVLDTEVGELVGEIITDTHAAAEGMSPEEERAMLDRVLANVRAQVVMQIHAERAKWERDQQQKRRTAKKTP
ncbi:helix-turn-helix domain-containing protein [Nocardiopsis mangrovi]|uniref:Helix-turn-helix domain-containing protein n=1 Tax=Nocardiopsis mangrovi TaxID=1179818 RepID=A0ABV9E4D0_9ACTN